MLTSHWPESGHKLQERAGMESLVRQLFAPPKPGELSTKEEGENGLSVEN